MAGLIVLDACVLIAFTDRTNRYRSDAERIMSLPDRRVMSALTGAEAMVFPTGDAPQWWDMLLRDLAIEIAPITSGDMEAIAKVRRETSLKMPDSVVVWLARLRGAAIASFDNRLLSKARQLGIETIT